MRALADAVSPGGLLLLTDTFPPPERRPPEAEHNRMRPLVRYEPILREARLGVRSVRPTHVLLNRDLGGWRFLNRAPRLLYGVDVMLLGLGLGRDPAVSKLLVARRS